MSDDTPKEKSWSGRDTFGCVVTILAAFGLLVIVVALVVAAIGAGGL